MSDPVPPPDTAARDRIRTALDETLFVEAGAGSGKTTMLVDRVVALVTAAGVDLGAIAAITFTEKAAAELRDRIRRELEARSHGPGAAAQACRRALTQVDMAAICTLHSFAQRILREHAVEAGLPPRVEVLDEVASSIAFDRRWRSFRRRILEDDTVAESIVLADAIGIGLDKLRHIAFVFGQNWDLVAERIAGTARAPEFDDPGPVLDELDAVVALRAHCTSPDDKLAAALAGLAATGGRLRAAPDLAQLLSLVRDDPVPKVGSVGRKGNWQPEDMCRQVRERVSALGVALGQWREGIGAGCLQQLGAVIADFTLEEAHLRAREGRLEFHDLLVFARSMLRDPHTGVHVRAALADRYRRILLDEFQDTDPIQVDLAVLIASDDPDAGRRPWDEVETIPGRLFFVGDPKQSIYRFRRADIAMFLKARERFAAPAVHLSTNFRSVAPVLDWVNAVFGNLVKFAADCQPEYVALHAVRDAPPTGPPVLVLGAEPHGRDAKADDLRAAEAAEVVAAIRAAVDDGWSVRDRDGTWRPARPGDIAVLLPARTSLPVLEDALEAAGVPYRAESSSLVYATRAVRDLMAVARAVDDPTDELAAVTALRSPMFGCGDDDLWRWKVEHAGRWNHQAPAPEAVPETDPVAAGMAYLRDLHRQRSWLAPSEVVDRVVRDRRLLEIGYAEGRPRDLWRRVRFVVDQARAWCDAEGGSLRGWLDWVGHQADDGGRVVEAMLPETDDDSVRIMTVHAAKGLQFPIAIVSGLSSRAPGFRGGVEVSFPSDGGVAYRTSGVVNEDYVRSAPLDEQMQHDERIRLLYVACTRAQDHLVVSLHRSPPSEPISAGRVPTNAELLASALGGLPEGSYSTPDERSAPARVPAGVASAAPADAVEADFDTWAAQRDSAVAAGSRPRTVAATTLAREESAVEADPGLDKAPRDMDLPPWHKGRYGNAVGRAVHGVLQTIDLGGGDGIEAAAAAQAAAEGVIDHEDTVRRLAAVALDAAAVREAVSCPFWRETYVAVPVGDTTLEGYVDLLYRRADGLVVVDYKTAGGADAAEIDRRLDRYRLQGGAYALAVAEATGEPVADCVFVFLTDAGPVERHLEDLGAAMAEAREAVLAR